MSTHSVLSPSKAERWISCPGSVALCRDIPDTTSVYAKEGTQAHAYAAWLLNGAKVPEPFAPSKEMVEYVSVYTNAVRRAGQGKALLVEQSVDISAWTGEKGGKGTADAIVIGANVLEVHDLKYGVGHIVDAENNYQLMLYALGALDFLGDIWGTFSQVKLVIHQPRRDHLSEWTISYGDLLEFGGRAFRAGQTATHCEKGEHLVPSEKACLWCPAKAVCPALTAKVQSTVFDDFAMVPESDGPVPNEATLNLIETWIAAIRAHVFDKLNRWESVPGWKLVAGRQGNRAWNDAPAVEAALDAMRIRKMDSHDMSLKSVAQMEKVVSKKKWAALTPLISRGDARPTMVAESDKRQALKPPAIAEDFDIFG